MKFKCPNCKTVTEINLGSLLGSIKSERKAQAARANAKRPRGKRRKKKQGTDL